MSILIFHWQKLDGVALPRLNVALQDAGKPVMAAMRSCSFRWVQIEVQSGSHMPHRP